MDSGLTDKTKKRNMFSCINLIHLYTWFEFVLIINLQKKCFQTNKQFEMFSHALMMQKQEKKNMGVAYVLYFETHKHQKIKNKKKIMAGLFLFKRILGEGGADKRFDPIRNNFPRFFMSWTLQAVWAYFCMLPVLVVQKTADDEIDLKASDYVGWVLWVFGFGFEVIADRQKTVFKENPANRGKFTNTGLWSISRHPNYFGEITLWWGLAIVACSVANDWLWLMFLSPIWTMVLLIGLSGIPLSEKTADRKYGHVEGYTEYKASTPVLIPFCYCWK